MKKNKILFQPFFLINTNFYNLYSVENTKIILEILRLGHDIGLHFDASFFKTSKSLNTNCKKELKALENIINTKVKIISFHRPAKFLLSYNRKIAGLDHSYMDKYTKNINYCSDSQGLWRFDTPQNILKNNDKKILLYTS